MNRKLIYAMAFLLGVAATIIGLMIASHFRAPSARPQLTNNEPSHPTNLPQPQPAPPAVEPVMPAQSVETVTVPVRPPDIQVPKPADETGAKGPAGASTGTPAPDVVYVDPAAKEALGRYALNYVGADPAADEVWEALIYDTSLPDNVREDLMEDLNENGFSADNGRTATPDDLPLIASRIVLVEDHMRDADGFMMEHLAEAHKDLVNMWFDLTRQ